MYNNIIFIDLQGFKINSNEFFAKEVAVVYNSNEFINFIIKPPIDFNFLSPKHQQEAKWLTKNFHHLNWNDGSCSFDTVRIFLKNSVKDSYVYVKGLQKKKWLEKIIQQKVFNIEDERCINFKQLEIKYPENIYCGYHNYGVCALKNARLLEKENRYSLKIGKFI